MTLEMAVNPAVAELYFWALQASFTGPDRNQRGSPPRSAMASLVPGIRRSQLGRVRQGRLDSGGIGLGPSFDAGQRQHQGLPVGARSRGIGCGSERTNQGGGRAR